LGRGVMEELPLRVAEKGTFLDARKKVRSEPRKRRSKEALKI